MAQGEGGVNPVGVIRVGVVGLGFMGRTHLSAYASAAGLGLPCVVTALADPNVEAALATAATGNPELARGGGPGLDLSRVARLTDPEDLLASDDVDAVSICTPTETHVPLAIRALARGKHVLVEKPIAVASADVARLAAAARGSGLVCMPAMCMRFWPGWSWLAGVARAGTLGPVLSATFLRCGPPPAWNRAFYSDYARTGGPLTDLHIHDADFVRFALGDPATVHASGSLDHVQTVYGYGPGGPRLVSAEGAQDAADSFPFRMRFTVVFRDATADFDLAREPNLMLFRPGASEAVPTAGPSGYDLEVRHFLDLVSARRAGKNVPPICTIEDAVSTARLLEAERRSLESGGPVPFSA